MKVAFETLGCRVNQYETEAMTEKFIVEGWQIAKFNEIADAYVINTCSVTNMGDKKSRQMISRARRLNKDAVIAVVGCYAQVAPNEVSSIEGVDIVLGTRNKGDITYYVNKSMADHSKVVEVKDVLKNRNFENLNVEKYQDKSKAYIKIQDGCNMFCSYCLIPYARGAVCSKEPEKVIDEINELIKNGYKEIILTGIHTASYGIDLKKRTNLIDLLEMVDSVSKIQRIRIGSLDPEFFTDEIIERVSKLKHICPHFHLSLQSGCNATLKRMNRHYTADEYERTVQNLRDKIPQISVTTDVIVGFPGETDNEFENTYEFLKRIKLSKTHIFKYSKRKGTRAANMPDQVDIQVKEERSKKLIELNKMNEKEFADRFIGSEENVLFEQRAHFNKDYYEGYTPNYIKVVVKSDKELKGEIKRCRMKSSDYLKNGEVFLNADILEI